MKLYRSAGKKTKAQAMVEFAIVLPLLLLLLYGILEAGRLLFIYSTIVTASRQAVRYGSATGQGITTTFPRYQDCAGIRAAAQKVDFLNSFDDSDITITYDNGPGVPVTTFDGTCDGAIDTGVLPSANNTTRVLVNINGVRGGTILGALNKGDHLGDDRQIITIDCDQQPIRIGIAGDEAGIGRARTISGWSRARTGIILDNDIVIIKGV